MIRIAIVEDEEMYVQQLTGYLKEYQKTYGEEIDITVYRDGDGITAKYKAQFDIILAGYHFGLTGARYESRIQR